MAGVGGILHCCLISQLMLLLSAANPSFVLLKEPLSLSLSLSITEGKFSLLFIVRGGYAAAKLLNLNKLQFSGRYNVLMARDEVIFILSGSRIQ